MFCNIIPDKILEKIGDTKSLKKSQAIRKKRAERDINIPIPAEHDEVRALYDANGSEDGGELKQVDKQHHQTEPSTNSHLEFFNKIYDFLHDIVGRESFDNHNAVMNIYENVGVDYNNAFWDGEQFKFGNGDGVYFNTFFNQNVATHECFHAVTQYTANLEYYGQSGALNESISDVFAVCLDQKLANQKPEEASWLIGEGIWTSRVNGKALRSFKNELAYDDPVIGKDDQPKHMDNYYNGNDDNGGVHINSGIPNHAFYQFCIKSGLNSWTIPMKVWYNALLASDSRTSFNEFCDNTMKSCPDEYKKTLYDSWKVVGIISIIDPPIDPEPKPEPDPDPEVKKNLFDYLKDFINWILTLLGLSRI